MRGIISLDLTNIAWMFQSITYRQTDITCCLQSVMPCPWGSGIDQYSRFTTPLKTQSSLPPYVPSLSLLLSLSLCPISAVKSRQGRPGLLGKTQSRADRSQVNWMEPGTSQGGGEVSKNTLYSTFCIVSIGKDRVLEFWGNLHLF